MFTALFTGGDGRHKGKPKDPEKQLKFIKRHPCPCCEREVAENAPRCPNCGNSIEISWLDSAVSLGRM
jgi:predicted amidophosphoribosyltransferase